MVKKEVVKRIRELKKDPKFRRPLLENDPRAPAFVETAPAIVMGKASERQLIAFRTPYCTHGKCTMCGFKFEAVKSSSFEDLKAQFNSATLIQSGRVSLCTSSSFFHPKVPFSFLEFMIKELAKTGIQKIDLESLPVDIINNIYKIRRLKGMLRDDQQLTVGMGLESQDDFVRSELVGKALPKELFEKAVGMLADEGVGVYAYVILKPPGLEEREAIEECVLTLEYFFSTAKKLGVTKPRANLKPLFIPKNTIAEMLFDEGLITPPRLWSLLEVLIRVHKLGNIFVPLTDESLAKGRLPANCEKCTDVTREAIRVFDANQDIKPLQELSCECKKEWKKEVE